MELLLIPTDAASWPSKTLPKISIPLLLSKENEPLFIGRNYLQDFFGIEDKKLSRGQLQAWINQDGQLMMRSKGINPSMLNNQPMEDEKEFKIQNADVIYLIPAFYGFRVIKGEVVKNEQNNNNQNNDNNNNKPNQVDQKPIEQKQQQNNHKRLLADESDEEVHVVREVIKSPPKNNNNIPKNNLIMEKNEGVDELIADVNKLKEVCEKVGFYMDDESGCWVVRMALDTTFLAKQNAKNWGITPNKPIIIQIKFTSDYLAADERPDTQAPYTLFVFQSSDANLNQPQLKDYETEFGVVQWFIETRVQNLLRKNWNNKPAKFKERSKKLAQSRENVHNNNNIGERDDGLLPGELEELMWMGFSRNQALQALKDAKGDLQQAVTMLLSDPKPEDAMEVVKQDNKTNKKVEKSNLVQDPNESPIETLKRFGFSEKECIEALQQTEGDVEAAANWLLEKGNKNEEEEKKTNKRKSPKRKGGKKTSPKKNKQESDDEEQDSERLKDEENLWKNDKFLANLYQYIHLRFITCPSHCLICDKNLDVAMYKLPVCSKVQCVKVYETTSVGTCANEIKNNPIVVDLLLTFLCAAVTSTNPRGWNRHGLGLNKSHGANPYANAQKHKGKFAEFEPFPYGLGFDSKKEQDGGLLFETINMIPAVSVLQQYSTDEQLKIVLDEISPLCFPLLRWVIQSCRVHLSPIPESKQIAAMKTPYQFQMVSSFPEHEKQFIAHKEKALSKGCISDTGSFFAFHGSHVSNWHSIVRTGLRSGFVPGIYMAQVANVSLGYMGVGQHSCRAWSNSMMNPTKSMGCISLIEVADHRKTSSITGPTDRNAINVAKNQSMVVTRFLFFYPNGPKWKSQIYASSLKIHDFMFLEDNKRKNDSDDEFQGFKKYKQ